MARIILKTDMNCESCVAKVKPALEAKGISHGLKFDMNSPDKTVQFEGTAKERDEAMAVLESLGYHGSLLEEKSGPPVLPEEKKNFFATYKPLIVVGVFLLGTTALVELRAGSFSPMRAMNTFMGGFFIFFSFFKFLGLEAFADAFSTYDLIAKKSRAYALVYPFLELALGVGFILGAFPVAVNVATIFLMVIGNVGVWKILRRKQTIECACLGTIFKLPMTKVTLFENSIMLLMSVMALGARF